MNLVAPFPFFNPFILTALLIWSIFWKSLALWRAVKGNQRNWFLAILILNTFGIIEIIYLLRFSKNKITVEDFKKKNFLPN